MNDGVYLLVMEDQPYGIPYVLKNHVNPDGRPFQTLAGVDGVKLLDNLKPGDYQLIPLVALTQQRLDAIRYASRILGEGTYWPTNRKHQDVLDTILNEIE